MYNYVLSDEEIEYLCRLGPYTGNVPYTRDNNLSWSIYPNPGIDIVYLDYNTEGDSRFIIKIYSLSGNVLHTIHKNAHCVSGTIEVDISGLEPGVYIIQMELGNTVQYKKLLISR